MKHCIYRNRRIQKTSVAHHNFHLSENLFRPQLKKLEANGGNKDVVNWRCEDENYEHQTGPPCNINRAKAI